MKKIFYSIIAALGFFSFISCGDMIESNSDSMVKDPALDTKSDSVFYALGIAQAMQELADQYFFVGEMRGELVKPTIDASTDLQQLSNYSADASNAYDSAYVYYKVINNCNYYLKHRNTQLYTGSINVVEEEYAAVMAYRAWAYLQLARTYGGNEMGIPFFTEPLTAISQINEANFPRYTLSQIVAALAPELEKYSGYEVPKFGYAPGKGFDVGTPNWSSNSKRVVPSMMFIPVDVVLGDMYLENAMYMDAAKHYAKYLANNHSVPTTGGNYSTTLVKDYYPEDYEFSFNAYNCGSVPTYYNISLENQTSIISCIPMAVNTQNGKTSNVPNAFGFDFYSIEKSNNCPRSEKIEVVPSVAYHALTDSCDLYYYTYDANEPSYPAGIGKARWGDLRSYSGVTNTESDSRSYYMLTINSKDTSKVYVAKNASANIILYRTNSVYLHLAEALNRAGYPDLSFAILRNGISTYLKELIPIQEYDEITSAPLPIPAYKYVSQESYDVLVNQLYFLNAENYSFFTLAATGGIHCLGGGAINVRGMEFGSSVGITGSRATAVGSQMNLMYLPKLIVGEKIDEVKAKFGVAAEINNQKDFIDAMELVLCDEYAKELAFEGCRFYDLQRMARHLNESGAFGGNFGSRWFAAKLAGNNPQKNLADPKNWYLPFK